MMMIVIEHCNNIQLCIKALISEWNYWMYSLRHSAQALKSINIWITFLLTKKTHFLGVHFDSPVQNKLYNDVGHL